MLLIGLARVMGITILLRRLQKNMAVLKNIITETAGHCKAAFAYDIDKLIYKVVLRHASASEKYHSDFARN